MPEFPDLVFSQDMTPYHPTLSVGWLGEEVAFNKGIVPSDFLIKLMNIVQEPSGKLVCFTRGFHDNIIPKDPEIKAHYQANIPDLFTQYPIGNGEIHFRHQAVNYAAPVMIYEYIVENGYLPPKEFIEAVSKGKLIREDEWLPFIQGTQEEKDWGPSMTRDEISTFYQKINAQQSEPEKLEKLLLQYRANYPGEPQVLFVLANFSTSIKKHAEGLKYANLFTEISPHMAHAYGTKGMVQFHLKNYAEAEQNLRLVLPTFRAQNERSNVNVLFALGNICEQKGKDEQALAYYQEALSYQADDQGIINAVARLEHKNRSLWQKIIAWIS
ncbi:MAG: tetratricopeptide repeat protein [Bacteroidota bacterium]